MKHVRLAAAAGVLAAFLATPTRSAADPITVMGTIEMNRFGGSISLSGEGLTFGAALPSINGPYQLLLCDFCAPGTVVGIGGEWSAQDMSSTISYQGQTFSGSGAQPRSSGIGSVTFGGTVIAPELVGTVATVTAPFSLHGFFRMPDDVWVNFNQNRVTFAGPGTATLTFLPGEGMAGWTASRASYVLDASPVPERATLALLLTGGVGVCLRLRRRVAHARGRPGSQCQAS